MAFLHSQRGQTRSGGILNDADHVPYKDYYELQSQAAKLQQKVGKALSAGALFAARCHLTHGSIAQVAALEQYCSDQAAQIERHERIEQVRC
jgi:hypothetical protein